jgi:beta-N-acetylhexosaminidase
MNSKIIKCLALLLLPLSAFCQIDNRAAWVDSVFHALNTNEKIGQLFMLALPADADDHTLEVVADYVKGGDIGGILVPNIPPTLQTKWVNVLQQHADVPLFVARDVWKDFSESNTFPDPLVLGAIANDTILHELWQEMAYQLKITGVNMNIGLRPTLTSIQSLDTHSFGSDKNIVAHHSVLFNHVMREADILSCANTFPIKSLTIKDVSGGIPVIEPQIDSVSFYPLQKTIQSGLGGLITSTQAFPIFYTNTNLIKKNDYNSASLSSLLLGRWLEKNAAFKGLTIADIRNFYELNKSLKEGDIEFLAFQGGNNIIITGGNPNDAIRKIRKTIRKDEILDAWLDVAVKKVLGAKYDLQLKQKQKFRTDNINAKLQRTDAKLVKQRALHAAVTIVKDQSHLLPISTLENYKIAYITTNPVDVFSSMLKRYSPIEIFDIKNVTSESLKAYNLIIASVYPENTTDQLHQLQTIRKDNGNTSFIVCDFGNYDFLKTAAFYNTVITGYSSHAESIQAVAESVFGASATDGILPITLSSALQAGNQIKTENLKRLQWSIPEDAGMRSDVLRQIDEIAQEAIDMKATPGCQILVARHGKVIYEKSFGTLTYESEVPVTSETIYDVASVTKVSATLQAIMFMHEKGLINIYKKISVYLPELKITNKKDITIIDMLTHQSGLVPFLLMYQNTVKDTTFLPHYYTRGNHPENRFQVGEKLYATPALRDSVWSWVINSKLQDKTARTLYPYKYSDLGFMLMQRLAERVLNQPLEEFLAQNFYEPLGANTTGFLPLARFSTDRIAPTEIDKTYRRSLVVGTVHDERAAMLGGVAGHAGLFSNAQDLAKLCQMLLQNGYYGGYHYYKPETVHTFTAKQFDKSRRGLGWDKPIQSNWTGSPTSWYASPLTYGHTGFTGTCIWIDPTFDLVYIFLSNRVYPNRSNKLINLNIRPRIQDVIYKSIFAYNTQIE